MRKIYSNKAEDLEKGMNQHKERYKLLFNRDVSFLKKPLLKIGIPRGLSMYEHYPFWYTLLTECNIKPVLSKTSTNRLYEKGIHSIAADNICFPAKLMHGHVMDLIDKKVDRILYPYTIFDAKETLNAHNSYNCPIVAGYSDVIKSAIDTTIPIDAPSVSFKDEKLLYKACKSYLSSLNIDKKTIQSAFEKALKKQRDYVITLAVQNKRIVENAKKQIVWSFYLQVDLIILILLYNIKLEMPLPIWELMLLPKILPYLPMMMFLKKYIVFLNGLIPIVF